MFTATSLGHQGWYLSSERTRLLVDPLLREDFGHAGQVNFRMFPPRAMDLTALPPIDAVLLTHEHEDHFDVPSLCLLDRRIPLFLSARSSSAAYAILGELGFTVRPVYPGREVAIGDLRVLPLSPNHVRDDNLDEWDVIAFVVRDEAGDGNLFSAVDVEQPAHCIERVQAFAGRPGLWCVTNNGMDCYFGRAGEQIKNGTPDLVRAVVQQLEELSGRGGAPEAVLINGGGFSFTGQDAWMNRCVFNTSSEAACELLGQQQVGPRVLWALPGRTFSMKGGLLRSVEERCGFLSVLPRESWPAHEAVASAPVEHDYPPVCGRKSLTDAERAEMGSRLSELAQGLYGSPLFRSLYSLQEPDLGGCRPTFALALLADEARHAYVLEYDPNSCRFVPLDHSKQQARVLAGLECWATDLLDVLGGRMAPAGLALGHFRAWNAAPKRFSFSLMKDLWQLHHPLRRPAEFAALYRRIAAWAVEQEPIVRAGGVPLPPSQ